MPRPVFPATPTSLITQTLASKWDTLNSEGITIGDDNPVEIEDWYFAIWAYNSGINPQASTGDGNCVPTPGPGCTDAAGNWGLGWTNNPANPTYDPRRHPFLHDSDGNLTYDDAASPQGWPYQEKVFGWIESGQYEGDGVTLKYAPTYDYADGTGFFLDLPSVYAFCDGSDNCSPGSAQPCGYNSPDDPLQWHCWWHNAASFCAGTCHDGSWKYHSADPEPTVPDPFPSVCDQPTAGAVIADDSGTETNLAGCITRYPDAAMTWYPDTDPGGGPFGDVDLHQLGTGYGGRTMFTHLEPADSPQWGGTMTWRPNNLIPSANAYDIEVFVPTLGAAGTLTYNVNNGLGQTLASVPVNQDDYGNQWVSIGTYALSPGASVDTTNVVPGGDGVTDVAFDAIAFLPMTTWTEEAARNDLLSALGGTVSGPDTGIPMWGVKADVYQPDGTITTQSMDTAKIIQAAADSYLAVYTSNSTVKLASSVDLMIWTYITDLDPCASQPYIAQEPNGSLMVADEKFDNGCSGNSHVNFLHFADLSSLESGQHDWAAAPPGTRFFSACNEGTPDIHGISTDGSVINFGFHYNSKCSTGLDREAFGTLSYPSGAMTALEDNARDTAVSNICYVVDNQPACYNGKHGDRDDIFWHGWRFSLQESQDNSDIENKYYNWQYILYDYSNQTAYPVSLPAAVDAPCHGNPALTLLTDPVGHPELLVAGFKFSECPGAGNPAGEFVYTIAVTGSP